MYAVSVPWATVRASSSYLALISQITTRDGFCYAATSSLNASWVRGSRNASNPVVVKYSFTSARVHSPLYLTLGVHRPAACARRLRLQSDERGLRALRAHAQFIATKSGRGSGNRTCRIFGGLGNHAKGSGYSSTRASNLSPRPLTLSLLTSALLATIWRTISAVVWVG